MILLFLITVQAGAKFNDIQDQLREKGQFLALDPPMTEQGSTIGGIISTNDSGPSRLRYQTCKEHILEVRVVRADGEIVRGGAKVVKNGAGYDLPKLFVGSLGTLGIIIESTLRVFPVPEKSVTYISGINDIDDLNNSVTQILNADIVLTSLEITNRNLSQQIFHAAGLRSLNFPYTLVLRIENVSRAVDEQIETVRNILNKEGIEGAVIENDGNIWEKIRNFSFTAPDSCAAFKMNALVTDIPRIIEYTEEVTENLNLEFQLSAKAGLGTVQVSVEGENKELSMCLELLRSFIIADPSIFFPGIQKLPDQFDDINRWGDLGSSSSLMKSLKNNFDPNNILNPGRLF